MEYEIDLMERIISNLEFEKEQYKETKSKELIDGYDDDISSAKVIISILKNIEANASF